jgi:hypothetical protein
MNKQIVATSTASMSNGEKIAVRKCSDPEDDLLQIYDTLKVDHIPIKARKFVWSQNADIKKTNPGNQWVSRNIATMWVKKIQINKVVLGLFVCSNYYC